MPNFGHQEYVLLALEEAGGRIEDPTGRVSLQIAEASGLTPIQVINAVQRLAQVGRIRREVRGKRTYSVELVEGTPVPEHPKVQPPRPPAAQPRGMTLDEITDAVLRKLIDRLSRVALMQVELNDARAETHRLREEVAELKRQKQKADEAIAAARGGNNRAVVFLRKTGVARDKDVHTVATNCDHGQMSRRDHGSAPQMWKGAVAWGEERGMTLRTLEACTRCGIRRATYDRR